MKWSLRLQPRHSFAHGRVCLGRTAARRACSSERRRTKYAMSCHSKCQRRNSARAEGTFEHGGGGGSPRHVRERATA
eukprot:scaffold5907_cov120-Isochrysis_galbana.AAC.8